jgi:hypothetical protein
MKQIFLQSSINDVSTLEETVAVPGQKLAQRRHAKNIKKKSRQLHNTAVQF